jgi:hypothetical protein
LHGDLVAIAWPRYKRHHLTVHGIGRLMEYFIAFSFLQCHIRNAIMWEPNDFATLITENVDFNKGIDHNMCKRS